MSDELPYKMAMIFLLISTLGTRWHFQYKFIADIIKYGNKSCTEACFESGFNSVEYFSYAFKRKYGMSPNNYKLGYVK
jgi:AraC-like DNA-binding protein